MVYKIIEEASIESLEQEVNRYIDSGWMPVGGVMPVIAMEHAVVGVKSLTNSSIQSYCQSMTYSDEVQSGEYR